MTPAELPSLDWRYQQLVDLMNADCLAGCGEHSLISQSSLFSNLHIALIFNYFCLSRLIV